MKRAFSVPLTLLVLALGVVASRAADPVIQRVQAQAACPTGIGLGSFNGTVSIDSSVAVISSGCPAGTSITYYVQIPSSPSHLCGGAGQPNCFHNFITTTAPLAWVDLSRNETHPTEFPDGLYSFWACASQCIQSGNYSLGTPSGAAGGVFNPWAPPGVDGSNMQWNRDLCETSTVCDVGAQQMQGEELDFIGNVTNNADGDFLPQNLNSFFSNPNPGDPQGGFTQLAATHDSGGYSAYFFEFTADVVYCAGYPSTASVTNPARNCQKGYAADGQPHAFWMQINPNPATCKDTRYQCLQVYIDGTYLAEERMVNGGDLHSPFIQNESDTSPHSSVWGAQLNYTDYSNENLPGSLNQGLSVRYSYNYQQWMNAQGQWAQFFWTTAGYQRDIVNWGATNGTGSVYCGPFDQAYYPDAGTRGYQSSAEWGTLNLHC